MHYQEFLDRVHQQSRLPDVKDAEIITRATLETLGERLGDRDRSALAAQLPQELKAFLHQPRQTDRYPVEEFYRRVGARAGGITYYDSAERVKAVMAVLQQAVTPGALEEVLAHLPDEFEGLFQRMPPGPGFPSA